MKLCLIIFNVFSVLLIPLEALFLNIPAWIFVLDVLLLTGLDVTFLIRFSKKKRERIFYPVLNGFIGIFLLVYTFCYPYFGSTVFKLKPHYYIQNAQVTVTQKQALKDLDFVYKKLNHIHIAMKNQQSEEAKKIDEAYKKATSKISSKEKFTVVELAQIIESMLSVLGDAHTTVYLNYIESQHYYKNVQKHNDANDDFVGINGITYENLLKKKQNLYSYEKESWAIKDMKNDSISLEGLTYLGIDASNGISYMIKTEDGHLYEEKVQKEDFITYDEYVKYNELDTKGHNEEKPFCYYSIDENKSLALLTLTSCRNNDFYAQTLNRMFTEIKEKNVKNLAIDVRNNGGGSSLVINKLFEYLNIDKYTESGMVVRYGPFMWKFKNPEKKNKQIKDLVFDGNVYLLCSNSSFSSAMMFAQFVKDNNVGKLIGEAPGNNPNGYGEVVHFDIPNSHIFVQISRKRFTRINQNTEEIYVEPDYPCNPSKAKDVLYDLL